MNNDYVLPAHSPRDLRVTRRAVVVVSPAMPRLSSGGPVGACYRLLSALSCVPNAGAELYCLCTSRPRVYRISSPRDLGMFAAAEDGLSRVGRLRERLIQATVYSQSRRVRSASRTLIGARRVVRRARLNSIVRSILPGYSSLIFHAHNIVDVQRVVESLGVTNGPKVRLLYTDHSKGGLRREYVERFGPSSTRDRACAAIERCQEMAVSAADVIAFPSRGAQQLWETYNPALVPLASPKSAILYNGIARPLATGSPADERIELRLFAIAEHVRDKGLDLLIRGMSRLLEVLPNRHVRLRVAGGTTPLTAQLIQMRNELGLQDKVEFVGRLPHDRLLRELGEAHIVVAFPRVVVFDLSILEAMGLRKPIVTTGLPGNIEALGSEYAMFVKNEDEFAQKVAELDRCPRLRDSIGDSNSQRYEDLFTSEAMTARHFELYEKLFEAPERKSTEVLPI